MGLEAQLPRRPHIIAVGLLFGLSFAVVAQNAVRAPDLVRHAGCCWPRASRSSGCNADALLFSVLPSAWQLVLLVAGQTLAVLFWPTLLHVFLVSPEPSPLLGRVPRLERWLYLPPLALLPFLAYGSVRSRSPSPTRSCGIR